MRVSLYLSLLLALMVGSFSKTCKADPEWQWSVPITSVTSSETGDHPRAWLYIPPTCKRVRAVIVGQHNLLEETVFNNPIIRRALADNEMAAVWISPALDGVFHPDQGAGEHFKGMMKALALESGYSELEWAPIIPIGHSAMAGYPYQFAAWAPDRTLVAISIKGNWPDYRNPGDTNFDNARLNGVPLLYIGGEYEDANGRAAKAANFRKNYPLSPLTMLADVGAGHFDFHDRLATYMALYLREVAKYRLPSKTPLNGPVTLKPIDPTKTGWLYDRWRLNEAPKAAPAPINKYTGPKEEAFWAFDGELAKATNDYTQLYQNKKPELLGYIQNDGPVLTQNPKAHEQVQLKVAPLADGTTFKITGTFIDTVPDGRPPGWTGLPVGSSITHAPDGGPIDIEVTTGPLQKLNDSTFAIRFGKTGFNNPKRGGDIWFQATQDGGTEYKRAVQQALMRIPRVNTNGAEQTILFPPLANQKVGVKSLPLQAISSAGVPVYYYVETGPARIVNDNTLQFTAIPPRTQFPIKVTVVAYQWGRSIEPKLKSAQPITRTFTITKLDATTPVNHDAALASLWSNVAAQAQAVTQANAPAPGPQSVPQAINPTSTPPLSPQTSKRNTMSVNFDKALDMSPEVLAGAEARVGNWNNLRDAKAGVPAVLARVVSKDGTFIPGMTVTFRGGHSALDINTYDESDDSTASSNDARLFNGAFDQDEGDASTVEVTGIPFVHYDVYFYRRDDGESRAGQFTIGATTIYIRGGKGNPHPDGTGYVRSNDMTQGQGRDIEQGNVVKFENLTGPTLKATFTAVAAGDEVKRNKVVGFQIVERN